MQGGDSDSPGTGESGYPGSGSDSGYGNYYPPPSQHWRSSPPPPPPPSHGWGGAAHSSQPWAPTSPPIRGQSFYQRTLSRPQSPYGDYRPSMDTVNYPRPDTPIPTVPLTPSTADFDCFTFEQLVSSPGRFDPTSSVPVQGRGGGSGGGRGGDGRGRGGGGRSVYYTKQESIAVAKAWDAITSDAAVGTDQSEAGFWSRVLEAYNTFKPENAAVRRSDQIRKKWGRILRAVKRFAGIYENNTRTAESGRSEADIRALSEEMYRVGGNPRFTYWDEYVLLQSCPKFKAICEGERESGPKRTKLGLAGNYSSSSGSRSIDLNSEVEVEPPSTMSRRPRPQGQQSTIRDARASRFSAAASGSRSEMSAPVSVLNKNLDLQMMKQLADNARAYESATDPITKGVYFELMQRLRDQLGLTGAAAMGMEMEMPRRTPMMPPSERRQCFF